MAGRVPPEVLQRFRRVPLFSLLSPRSLRALVRASRETDVRAGRVLVREGDTDRDLYVVMRGEALVTRGGVTLTTLTVGDFFGEFALISGEPRAATVAAATDMRVMVLSYRAMAQAVDREPLLARRMLEAMGRRLAENERLDHGPPG